MNFIKNLADNYKIPEKPISIDLILEGGACNIGYMLGSLLLIKELEKRHYYKIERISGCSAGAIMAFYFITDTLEDWIHDYKKIRKYFINELNISIVHDILGEKVLNMPDEIFNSYSKDKLYINYRDKDICCAKKNVYENKKELLTTICKSIHIPYFIDSEMYYDECIDGGLPYIFNTRDERDNPMLYISISNYYLWLKSVNIHKERNVYGRLVEGALQTHNFLHHKHSSYICSYINDWSVFEWTMVRLNQWGFYIFVLVVMNLVNLLKKIYPYICHLSVVKKFKELVGEYIKDLVLLLLI